MTQRAWPRLALVALIGVVAAASACFSPDYRSGDLRCSSGTCPSGFYCGSDHICWRSTAGGPSGNGDPPAEPPTPVAAATVWLSCGGGAAIAPSEARLNLTIGASSVADDAVATSGNRLSFGFMSSGTGQ
jgi:hypothetical protein